MASGIKDVVTNHLILIHLSLLITVTLLCLIRKSGYDLRQLMRHFISTPVDFKHFGVTDFLKELINWAPSCNRNTWGGDSGQITCGHKFETSLSNMVKCCLY